MVYADLNQLVQAKGLPERTTLGLIEAAFGLRVRNSSYRATTEISNNLASRDLKALVDADLLVPEGEKRGRDYVASDAVKKIRAARRLPKWNNDPFSEPTPDAQASLFDLLRADLVSVAPSAAPGHHR